MPQQIDINDPAIQRMLGGEENILKLRKEGRLEALGINDDEPLAAPPPQKPLRLQQPLKDIAPTAKPSPEDVPDIGGFFENLGRRAVNAVQGAQVGRTAGLLTSPITGPAGPAVGAIGGALIGGAIPPTGNEQADLTSLLVEGAASRVPARGLLARGARQVATTAGIIGGTQAVTGNNQEAFVQASANLFGGVIGLSSRGLMRQSAKMQRRISDIGPTGERLQRAQNLTPDEAIVEFEKRFGDQPITTVQRTGSPQRQRTLSGLISSSGSARLEQRAADIDVSLNRAFRKEFGPEPEPANLESMTNWMATAQVIAKNNGTISIQVPGPRGGRVFAANLGQLPPSQVRELDNILGTGNRTQPFEETIERVLGGEGFATNRDANISLITGIRKVFKQAKRQDFDKTFKQGVLNMIYNGSQSRARGVSGKTDFTDGAAFATIINSMSPAKLTALFDEDGAAAVKLFAKAFDAMNPLDVYANSDLVPVRYLINKLGFEAASRTTSGQGGFIRTLASAPIASGLLVSIGEIMAGVTSSPKLSKALVTAATEKDPQAINSFLRLLMGKAITTGQMARDPETGEVILSPFSTRPPVSATRQESPVRRLFRNPSTSRGQSPVQQ